MTKQEKTEKNLLGFYNALLNDIKDGIVYLLSNFNEIDDNTYYNKYYGLKDNLEMLNDYIDDFDSEYSYQLLRRVFYLTRMLNSVDDYRAFTNMTNK